MWVVSHARVRSFPRHQLQRNGHQSIASFQMQRRWFSDEDNRGPWFRWQPDGGKGDSFSSSNGNGRSADSQKKNGSSRALSADVLPQDPSMMALPLSRKPLFPGQQAILTIGNKKVQEAIISRLNTAHPHGPVYLALFHRKSDPSPKSEPEVVINPETDIYHTGTMAQIIRSTPVGPSHSAPSEFSIVVQAHRRLDFVKTLDIGPPLKVQVNHWRNTDAALDPNDPAVRATMNEVLEKLRDIARINPLFKEGMQLIMQQMRNYSIGISEAEPGKLADFAVSLVTGDVQGLMEVLTEANPLTRLELVLALLHKELEVARVQAKIQGRIEETMGQQQKEFFLRQQLKSIKQELGLEKDDKEAIMKKYRDRLENKQIPKEAKEAIDTEMDKINSLEKNSSEFNISRNYLDWLTCLPWSTCSKENFDLKNASAILNKGHYGLQDVKERILEFIAVSKLRNGHQGKIICLVGPPGVGKTSIGQSIAEALNREFFRFSVGGLYDVAEIKGHRRTYVGAMPGKLIQGLKKTQTSNPLVMIDEIDKLGRGHQGDPASALLELLDPAQNSSFVDHYLDVPVDMSQVLFIVTANVTDTIPGPLMDRMELIRVSGYDLPEKLQIAQRHLLPKTFEQAGLEGFEDKVKESALDSLIRWHCREAGVRNLEKKIEMISRKMAYKVVQLTEEASDDVTSTASSMGLEGEKSSASVSEEESEGGKRLPDAMDSHITSTTTSTCPSRVAASDKSDRIKEDDDVVVSSSSSSMEGGEKVGGELPPNSSAASGGSAATRGGRESIPDDVRTGERVESEGSERPEATAKGEGSTNELTTLQRMIEDDDSQSNGEEEHESPLATDSTSSNEESAKQPKSEEQKKEEPPVRSIASMINKDDIENITAENLSTYAGKPVFTSDRLYETTTPAGVVMGLAWTAMGGSSLYIESVASKGKGTVEVTGQLGSVMTESTKIAKTVTKTVIGGDSDFFEEHHVHIHVPEGAIPKDGPSAGVTIVSAMLSLATNTPLIPDVAMTGEITLLGKVLPVGGIKEKTIAARRSGVKILILPKGNEKDVHELPEYLKEGLSIHFASEYADVQNVIFPHGLNEVVKAKKEASTTTKADA